MDGTRSTSGAARRESTPATARGPMYRRGAPFRCRLCAPDEPGAPLVLTGRIVNAEGEPLAGAVLDVWHTDARGVYSNVLGLGRPRPDGDGRGFNLRGRTRTDASGRYRIETVLPGHYPLGRFTRPRHIHMIVSHPSCETLTTQVFFAGDRRLSEDPYVAPALVVPLAGGGDDGPLRAAFDIVLDPCAPIPRASPPLSLGRRILNRAALARRLALSVLAWVIVQRNLPGGAAAAAV